MQTLLRRTHLNFKPCCYRMYIPAHRRPIRSCRKWHPSQLNWQYNYPGVTVDNKLNFNDHIYTLCAKAGKQLNALQRLSKSLDKDSKLAMYKNFIVSNFNFCPVVWIFTSKSSLIELENIQKRALRFVLCDYDSCYENLLTAASVPGIGINLLSSLAIEVFKCVNGLYLDSLNKLIHKKSSPYELRDTSIVSRPKVDYTHYGLKTFISYEAKV